MVTLNTCPYEHVPSDFHKNRNNGATRQDIIDALRQLEALKKKLKDLLDK